MLVCFGRAVTSYAPSANLNGVLRITVFGRVVTSYASSANLNGVLGITVTSPLIGLYRAPTGGGGARVGRGSLGCGGGWGPKSSCLLPGLYVTVCMGGGRTGRGAGVGGMGGSSSLYVGRLTGGGRVGRLTGARFGRRGRLTGRHSGRS